MARIITFIIFGGFGFVLLYVGVTQYFQQRRLLANAERVDARIVHSEVFTSTSADTDRRPLRSTSTTTHRPDAAATRASSGREARPSTHPTPPLSTSPLPGPARRGR